ncbi:MAG: hypothetical protein NC182_01565 [Prevotella sp.]|nr:hypothetical protein [Staphylococcus sp.]MCM1349870.1 hypothetical protein [Prevotella sp.]
MQEILNQVLEFVKSSGVLNIGLVGSVLYFIFSKVIDKVAKTKLTIKLDKKSAEIKEIKNMYDKYVVNAENTVDELKKEYLKMAKALEQSVEIAKKQNEALTIAFNNSNLQASAKLLVEDILKIKEDTKDALTAIENNETQQLPDSNAIIVEQEAKEDEKKEIKRVK